MRNKKMTAIMMAAGLIAVGLLISLTALAMMRFDFKEMNSVDFVTNTHEIKDTFDSISISGAECDILLLPTDDGSCRVVCTESEQIIHTVSVKGNTLTVEREDNRSWYEHVGVYWDRMEVIVYLPSGEYDSLYASTMSGDIEIPADFHFAEADIRNTSGKITFEAFVTGNLAVKTVSGNIAIGDVGPENLIVSSTSGSITLSSVRVAADIEVKSVSGRITLSDVECLNVTAESTSGKIILTETFAVKNVRVESVSGGVELEGCDAESLWIKTVSGSVSGTILTEKIFRTETSSGRVNVPDSAGSGRCEVKTTSGNIQLEIGK